MIIRPVRIEDAVDLHKVRTMEGVRENIMSMGSERLTDMEAYLKGLTPNDHVLVAEMDERAVACAVLQVSPRPRTRHVGGLGIMVHADFQGQGIGRALMGSLLDIADNWLMLKRVELDVYVDNRRAVQLYEKFGFVIEGTKKYAVIRCGAFIDAYLMARCRE